MRTKRLLKVLAVLALLMLLLCGCSRLSTDYNLIGAWRSEDGFTASFDGKAMTLCDEKGVPLLDEPMKYSVTKNTLYVVREGQVLEVFECRSNGEHMTLIYTDTFLKLCGRKNADSIYLTRVSDDPVILP